MTLDTFKLDTVDIRLTQELSTAVGSVGDRSGLILRVRTSDGLTGVGGTAPLPGSQTRLDELAAEVEGWAQSHFGHGEEPEDVLPNLDDGLSAPARFALHTALLDVQAQQADAPLAQFLRSGSTMAVPTNALVSASAPGDVFAQCQAAVNDGFTALKLKVAVEDPGVDATRIIAASEACGPNIKLRVDANGGWSMADAVHVVGRVGRHRLEYVEDPVADPQDFAAFTEETGVPTAVDVPSEWATDLSERIQAVQCAFVVMKPAAVGGLDRLLRTAVDLASTVTTVVSSSIDEKTALAAAVHVAAALPVPTAHGLATGPLVAGVPEALFPVDGSVQLSGPLCGGSY